MMAFTSSISITLARLSPGRLHASPIWSAQARPRIRPGLFVLLLLILLGVLFLQWPRPAPTPASSGSKPPALSFLSATTLSGLIFLQSTDYTLTASQMTTGHVRWHRQLPAVSTIVAAGQTLYCLFRTDLGHTELEALAAPTGSLLWHYP